MDFISQSLITLNQPNGFWESILNAFRSAMGTYILAVILLAVIVRILFSVVDIINKRITMKNSGIQAKMQPELDAVKKKYGHDQQLLQQKTNEIYKKYQFNMMGTCLPMLIVMILQFTVFLTLWNSLRDVSSFNIASQYQGMKEVYANVIALNGDDSFLDFYQANNEDKTIEIEIKEDENGKYFNILAVDTDGGAITFDKVYFSDFSNEEVFNLIQKYVWEDRGEDETPGIEEEAEEEGDVVEPEEPQPADPIPFEGTIASDFLKEVAEKLTDEYYNQTREKFLWIKNVYLAEAPMSPVYDYAEIKGYISPYYTEEEKESERLNNYEENIYNFVIASVNTEALGVNGYYILTIIAVLTSVLSLWLSNFLMKNKNQTQKQKQPWMMYVIMPIIMGIFTFMYTSLFAIYIIVGQIMMIALTPLTTLIVRKWMKSDENKKKDKNVVEVDYRRKDI